MRSPSSRRCRTYRSTSSAPRPACTSSRTRCPTARWTLPTPSRGTRRAPAHAGGPFRPGRSCWQQGAQRRLQALPQPGGVTACVACRASWTPRSCWATRASAGPPSGLSTSMVRACASCFVPLAELSTQSAASQEWRLALRSAVSPLLSPDAAGPQARSTTTLWRSGSSTASRPAGPSPCPTRGCRHASCRFARTPGWGVLEGARAGAPTIVAACRRSRVPCAAAQGTRGWAVQASSSPACQDASAGHAAAVRACPPGACCR